MVVKNPELICRSKNMRDRHRGYLNIFQLIQILLLALVRFYDNLIHFGSVK
jgi:hypothetical protein